MTKGKWSSSFLKCWKRKCRLPAVAEQIITELEAVGVLAAINQWKVLLSRKHMVCFLDNEGARGAILQGRSSNSLLNTVAQQVCDAEDANCVFSWYARIPSASNLADPPSRGIPHSWLVASKEVQLKANVLSANTERFEVSSWPELPIDKKSEVR